MLNSHKMQVPLGSDDFDPDGDITALAESLEAMVIVTCVNEADQAAAVAVHSPTANKPLYVRRVDLGNEYVTTDGTSWRPLGGGPGAAVARNNVQSIPNVAFTAISFDSEIYDDGDMWSPGAPTRLTCKKSGLHQISWSLSFINSTGRRGGHVRINGAEIAGGGSLTPAGDSVGPNVSFAYPLTTGDYIQLFAFQESGAAQNTAAASAPARPFLSAVWLRP